MSDLIDTAASIATVIGLPATLVGLVFVALQMRKNTATQRGKFFRELYEPFFLKEELRYAFTLIEGRKDKDAFREHYCTTDPKEYEKKGKPIETLFAHFEIICSLYRRGLIDKGDMHYFDYNIQRVLNHPGFNDYRAGLNCWRKSKGLEQIPYSTFFWYIDENSKRRSKEGRPDVYIKIKHLTERIKHLTERIKHLTESKI
jgi:hypothetical protein